MSNDNLSITIIGLLLYYLLVGLYVLGFKKHLSVPAITSKLPITDHTTYVTATIQLIIAILLALYMTPINATVVVTLALVLSLGLLWIMEVLAFSSLTSLTLQVVGILVPSLIPSPFGYFIAPVILVCSVLAKDVWYDKRYQRRIEYLYKKYYRIFANDFTGQPADIQRVAMAVLLCESLSRPSIFRLLERVAKRLFYRDALMSTGIMQVKSQKVLSDKESVQLGIKIVKSAYKKYHSKLANPYEAVYMMAYTYNMSDEYADYVVLLYYFLIHHSFYREPPYSVDPVMIRQIENAAGF